MRATPGPFASIDMGGMFTLLKVRERPELEDGRGWYVHNALRMAFDTLATPGPLPSGRCELMFEFEDRFAIKLASGEVGIVIARGRRANLPVVAALVSASGAAFAQPRKGVG